MSSVFTVLSFPQPGLEVCTCISIYLKSLVSWRKWFSTTSNVWFSILFNIHNYNITSKMSIWVSCTCTDHFNLSIDVSPTFFCGAFAFCNRFSTSSKWTKVGQHALAAVELLGKEVWQFCHHLNNVWSRGTWQHQVELIPLQVTMCKYHCWPKGERMEAFRTCH